MKHNTSGTEHKKGTICLCTHCSNTSHLSWVRPWADLNEKEKSPLVSMREDPCTSGKARVSCIVASTNYNFISHFRAITMSNQTLLPFLELAQSDWGQETQHSVPGQGYAITSTPIDVFPLTRQRRTEDNHHFCAIWRDLWWLKPTIFFHNLTHYLGVEPPLSIQRILSG